MTLYVPGEEFSREYPVRIGTEAIGHRQFDEIRSPWDGALVGRVGRANAGDMDRAIAAAASFAPTFARTPAHERAAICERVAHAITTEVSPLAQLITAESGKPIRYATAEVHRAALTFKLAAAEARRLGGEVLPLDLAPAGEGTLGLYRRVSLGPIAAISPYNFPLNLVAHKVAPAIAVGAPTILKPPPQSPLSALRLRELLLHAHLPAEALTVLHCEPEVAELMVTDPRMLVLSFTGSDAVGHHLQQRATGKRVLLELGGNAPCIIDEGIHLPSIMPRIIQGAWANAGQVCVKAQRFYVHHTLYPEFLPLFVAETRALAVGDPSLPDTVVGPLITPSHAQRVESWIAEALQAGATLHCGGQRQGQLIHPAILTGVPHTCSLHNSEVFGPAVLVEPFSHFNEAIERCNASRYGLQAGVFTPSIAQALQAFEALQFGGVVINDTSMFRVDNFPYGGTKDSGLGREGVSYAVQEYTETKMLIIRPN